MFLPPLSVWIEIRDDKFHLQQLEQFLFGDEVRRTADGVHKAVGIALDVQDNARQAARGDLGLGDTPGTDGIV